MFCFHWLFRFLVQNTQNFFFVVNKVLQTVFVTISLFYKYYQPTWEIFSKKNRIKKSHKFEIKIPVSDFYNSIISFVLFISKIKNGDLCELTRLKFPKSPFFHEFLKNGHHQKARSRPKTPKSSIKTQPKNCS